MNWIFRITIFKSHVSLLDLCDFVNFLSRLRLQDNFYPAIKLRPTLPKKGERSSQSSLTKCEQEFIQQSACLFYWRTPINTLEKGFKSKINFFGFIAICTSFYVIRILFHIYHISFSPYPQFSLLHAGARHAMALKMLIEPIIFEYL